MFNAHSPPIRHSPTRSPARHWPTADRHTGTPDPVPTDRRPCGVCSVERCDWTVDGAAGCRPVGGALCALCAVDVRDGVDGVLRCAAGCRPCVGI